MSPPLMRARLALLLAAALTLFALALGFAASPRANAASTPGSITITPSSGPVGTPVQANLFPPADATGPVMYSLGTTTTDPATGGCSTQKPIPGVGTVNVGTQGGGTTFDWPASLNQGPYWLCATPTSGSGATLYSRMPYTVTAADTPTATATAMPRTTASAVVANVPAGGVLLGSTFTMTVTHWVSSRGTPPDAVNLTAVDPSQHTSSGDSGTSLDSTRFTIAPGPGAGDYVLTVTVPDTLTPLTYWAYVSDQGGGVYSGPFKVIAPATPPPVSSPDPSRPDGLSSPTIFVSIIIVLICVAVIMLTRAFLRRRTRSYR